MIDYPPIVNSIAIAVLSALMAFLAAAFWTRRAKIELIADTENKARQEMLGRVQELENKLLLLNQAVVPISAAFQAILVKELTHNHTPEMDELMTRIGPPNMLSAAELHRLDELLKERVVEFADPLITDSERDAAAMLTMVMKRVAIEAKQLTTEIQVVSLPLEKDPK